ncbi:MAG: RluA family pseudouridine synthase [Patescibacteria group bacterium]|jgi:23S rRNA pseudouridine1911/1915/1917 synthase
MDQQSVVFEDSDLLVINKPSGLIVNNSLTAREGTLQDMILGRIVIPDDESEFALRGGIVHRLDKDTSGLILIAKNKSSFESVKAQFKQRKVEKHYFGVVVGEIEDEILEINAPIKRNPQNRMRFAVVEDGKEALTTARKIKIFEGYTFMDISPKTGRTHQIRVHFAALGHPIAGDPLYCSRSFLRSSLDRFGRMMLHAYSLSFSHPVTGKPMVLSCFPDEPIWKLFIPHK